MSKKDNSAYSASKSGSKYGPRQWVKQPYSTNCKTRSRTNSLANRRKFGRTELVILQISQYPQARYWQLQIYYY